MTLFEKYIQRYLDLLPSENWLLEMQNATNRTLEIYSNLSEEQGLFAYSEGKWTLKTLLEHLTDTEKIFQYRALRFARKDSTNLAGFDENLYAENGIANQLTLAELMEEFQIGRLSSLVFYTKLTPEQLQQSGTANENPISVETLGKLIVGHNLHHIKIIEERYLPLL